MNFIVQSNEFCQAFGHFSVEQIFYTVEIISMVCYLELMNCEGQLQNENVRELARRQIRSFRFQFLCNL